VELDFEDLFTQHLGLVLLVFAEELSGADEGLEVAGF
jgi:hypothetical protein